MSGELAAPNLGFHQIAMQVAIASAALKKTETDMLAACAGLIANHVSDGSRYNTPEKRRRELCRMHAYCADNPLYTFSAGAVRVLLPEGTPAPDLSSLPAAAGEVTGEGDGEDGSVGGVIMAETGIWVKGEKGTHKVCDVSFRDVRLLRDPRENKTLGFEVEVLLNGENRGRQLLITLDATKN